LIDGNQLVGNRLASWNGRIGAAPGAPLVAEGWYTYKISATGDFGTDAQQGTIYIDRSIPVISNAVATGEIPDAETTCSISYDLSENSLATVNIYTSSNILVRTWSEPTKPDG
jgi:PKD repeat protein